MKKEQKQILFTLISGVSIGLAAIGFWVYVSQNEKKLVIKTPFFEMNVDFIGRHIKDGGMYLKRQKYELAKEKFNKAIALDSENIEALIGHCYANSMMKLYAEAIQDCSRVIQYDSNNLKAYGVRGGAYYELKQFDSALKDLNRAIELNDENETLFYNRGGVLNEMKQFEASLDDMNRAIELAPDEGLFYLSRSRVLANLKQYEKSLDDIKRARELGVEDPNLEFEAKLLKKLQAKNQ